MKSKDYAAFADDSKLLLETLRAFCRRQGIAESTFGRLAVNDGKFAKRIAGGSQVELDTARRVAEFIDDVEQGRIRVRGRPRRKQDKSTWDKVAELIDNETTIRTPGSLAFYEQRQRYHVFANTTNESWVLADRVANELQSIRAHAPGIRIFYAPMDNGITLTRMLRALHAYFPNVPVLVVLKGRGLEDLRNTMGRLIDRLIEHPLCVFVLTNLYYWEALDLQKTSDDNPHPTNWQEVALTGQLSFDYQNQIATLYEDLASEWQVLPGDHSQPVYARPSVVTIFREDHRFQLESLIPTQDSTDLHYDYCLLNHPYLHTHTMKFRIDFVLKPVLERLAPGGRMTVVQAYGHDPSHDIVRQLWPDQPLDTVSRHDIISQLQASLRDDRGNFSFTGYTDKQSLFRFDMHTLPVFEDQPIGALTLASAWNNAVYFAQVKETLAQEGMHDVDKRIAVTDAVLRENGGLWFVNETFSATRKV